MKIRIKYMPYKCVGNGKCAEEFPERFSVIGNKAALKDGKKDGKDVFLEIDADENMKEKAVKAAMKCPTNSIGVMDAENNKMLFDPEIHEGQEVIEAADAEDYEQNKDEYFVVKADKKENRLEVEYWKKGKQEFLFTGEKPLEVYMTIIKKGLVKGFDQSAFLGRELQKKYIELSKD